MISRLKLQIGIWLGVIGVVGIPGVGRGYDEIGVSNGGSISGYVRVEGKVNKPGLLEVTKNKELCGKVTDDSLVVGIGQGLRYAVVTLEGISRGKALEKEAVHELDNVKCRFAPHIHAASVGQFLLLKNSDAILHTAHAYTPQGQPQFNVGLYPGRVSRKPLVSAGVIKILCEVHPWMSAYVVASEHPYYAVTDAYGEYQITDIPAGKYRLKVWHESLGVEERQVEVKGGALSKMDFALSAAPGGKKK